MHQPEDAIALKNPAAPTPGLAFGVAQAVAERQKGGTLRHVIGILDSDPTDALAQENPTASAKRLLSDNRYCVTDL